METNEMVYYLKIIHAFDYIFKSQAERIVYGNASQYRLLQSLAIDYTAQENCLALVGLIEDYMPEKAYFEGKELTIAIDDRDNVEYCYMENGVLQTLGHSVHSFYLEDANNYENF
jgi:hypothetical protein